MKPVPAETMEKVPAETMEESACGNPDAGECRADRQGCRGNM